ncbi:hypothetical protein ABZY09_13090 [Streptomyces sp. NPDC002928]|uniref:hypothetical protein n=1 Tax=Streptomyces sp. NPDC002928 TaxID=3154440 RepID=UPI0033B72A07
MSQQIAHPSDDQLLDLFNWASPGMVVTDSQGRVVIANKAAGELVGENAAAGQALPEALGIANYAALAEAGRPVENRAVIFTADAFPTGFANIGFGEVDGERYGFWALRPETIHPTPSPAPIEGAATAASWIGRVDARNAAYQPVTADSVALIQGYYDHCPVAIHLIEEDGTVSHANWKDIAIVGATEQPDTYVGHHIRHIYADQEVVDDFLGRWGEDAPIIDFRADFLNSGERVPVVIFSTANVADGKLKNTRCFVFSDNDPRRSRDRVAALDLAF